MGQTNQKFSGGAIIDGVSMAASITSDIVALFGKKCCGIQLTAASATHVGSVAVQVSNDGTNWNDVTLNSYPAASSGSAFNAHINLVDIVAKFLRVVYTATSGAGTLYCYATPAEG